MLVDDILFILRLMENLLFSINTVLPVFLIILLGIFLKKKEIINENFISLSSYLVFKVSLPALVFIKISQTNFTQVFDPREVLLLFGGSLLFYIISWILSIILIKDLKSRGSFIQGSFRGNIAIIGLAIVFNVFGESGLTRGAILLAFAIPLFNTISVIALVVPLHQGAKGATRKIISTLFTNPLILAVIFALPFSLFNIYLPVIAQKTLSYLSKMTLPLALIGVGGSLSFHSLKEKLSFSIIATIIKILLIPVTVSLAAYYVGIRNESLGILFIVSGVPTAIASFIMAKSMHNDSHLAANIILLTTLGSVITIGFGIFFLKALVLI